MRVILIMVALTGLAACGADAPPFVPNASAGVSLGSGGISTQTSLGLSNGFLSLGLTL